MIDQRDEHVLKFWTVLYFFTQLQGQVWIPKIFSWIQSLIYEEAKYLSGDCFISGCGFDTAKKVLGIVRWSSEYEKIGGEGLGERTRTKNKKDLTRGLNLLSLREWILFPYSTHMHKPVNHRAISLNPRIGFFSHFCKLRKFKHIRDTHVRTFTWLLQ